MEIYQDIFNALTFPCFLLEPKGGQFLIREINKEYGSALTKRNLKFLGMSIPEVFHENPEHLGTSWEELYNSFNKVFVTGEPDSIKALRYDLMNCEIDEFGESYWQIENIPIKDKTTGLVIFIVLIARDKTLEVLEKMK